MAISLNTIKTLFTEYRTLESRFWQSRFEVEQQQFSQFQQRFLPFDRRLQALRQEETPFFNIFDILNIRHYETKVHTPFLCHLLDPDASHEQGALFLDSFFRNVLNLPFTHDTLSHYKVREELLTDSLGRLDIFMGFIHDDRPKAIVIENKIYAADQEQQLTRYHHYLTDVLSLAPEDYWLFYLTPKGTSPTTNAISAALADQLRQSGCLSTISYHQHITNWLNDCYPRVSSPRVRHTLYQYLITIASL